MKRIICLLMALLLVLTLAACGKKASGLPVNNETNQTKQSETNAGPKENTENVESDKEKEPDVVEPPEPEPRDPLEELSVPLDVARNSYGAYLIRGEKYYSLNVTAKKHMDAKNYGFTDALGDIRFYYPTSGDAMISLGDVEVPVLEDGDIVAMFSQSGSVPTLELRKVQFVGYTIPALKFQYNYQLFDLESYSQQYIELRSTAVNNFTVSNEAGEELKDWTSLEYGKKYLVSWFTGTQYTEIEMFASSKYYVPETSEFIELEGELSKEGYVKFDLTQLPAGLYNLPTSWLGAGGLIEIK